MSSKGWEPCTTEYKSFWFDLLKWKCWQLLGPKGGLFLGSPSQGSFPSSAFYRFIQVDRLLRGRSSMWEVSWLGYWHLVVELLFYPSATWTKKQKVVFLWNFGLMPNLASQAGKQSHLKKREVGIPCKRPSPFLAALFRDPGVCQFTPSLQHRFVLGCRADASLTGGQPLQFPHRPPHSLTHLIT